jgi:hypothetical protein
MSALDTMRAATAKASINLRGDLAKLSDDELAERLDAAWLEYESARHRKGGAWFSWPWRGPIRHPRVYRFLSALGGTSGDAVASLVFATILSTKRFERLLRDSNPPTDENLALFKIRDIMDEIKRRLAQRKAAGS